MSRCGPFDMYVSPNLLDATMIANQIVLKEEFHVYALAVAIHLLTKFDFWA